MNDMVFNELYCTLFERIVIVAIGTVDVAILAKVGLMKMFGCIDVRTQLLLVIMGNEYLIFQLF